MELKNISGVEIFAVGTWNGDTYTEADLDEMVRAYNENRQTLKLPLKLGHDENQKLLQKDGLPAAGWVSNVYRSGQKLIADFIDIPNKIYDLIVKKAFRKVSSEIYWNIDINGTKYSRLLSAVSLLGSDMPAVTCLNDILAMYGVKTSDKDSHLGEIESASMLRVYSIDLESLNINKEEHNMTEQELKEMESKLSLYEEEKKLFTKTLNDKEVELAELKKFKADAEAKQIELERQAFIASMDAKLTELESQGLVSPAMKPYVKALLVEEKKEYSIGEKQFDRVSLISEILKLHSVVEKVNTEPKTVDEKKEASNSEKILSDKIASYAKEHKCSYGTAYKAVLKQENKEVINHG